MQNFNLAGLLARFIASMVLVFATFNPSGYSFVHWVAGNFPHLQPLQVVVGIALAAVWLFFLHATWRSLGTLGVSMGAAFFAAVIWLFASWGWFTVSNHHAIVWLALAMIACLLTLGLSWALIQARVSGQSVVTEIKH
jgi:hypothetical protein